MTTDFDQDRSHGFTTSGRLDGERVFRRAKRHSGLVRALRVGIPFGMALFFVVLGALVWFQPLRSLKSLPASMEQVVVSGTKITMAAPKISGFTRDSRKYDLSARTATQDITNPDVLELHGIAAKFETVDNTKFDLTAATGVFARKTNLLTLRQDVVLVSSSGFEIRLDEARIDTVTTAITSDKPVRVTTSQGTINANRFEVRDGGDLIIFDGGVKALIAGDPVPAPQPSGKP